MIRELQIQGKLTEVERESILNIVREYGQDHNRIAMRRELESMLLDTKRKLKYRMKRKVSDIITNSK